MKKRVLLLVLTLVLLITCAVFTVSASGEETTNAFEANFVCPCGCKKAFDEIEWRDWGNTALSDPYSWGVTDHYWIDSTMNPGGVGTLTGTGTDGAKKIVVVFHDPSGAATYFGSTLTNSSGNRTNRTFVVPKGTTAWLIGDNATVWGPCASKDAGGIIKVGSGAIVNISGLKLRSRTNATNVPTNGGIIYNEGTLTLNNCTVTGIPVSGNDGAIWSSGNVTLSGTTAISNGNAVQGGNIHMEGKGSAAAVLTIKDTASVKNGVASNNGGNIALVYSSKAANMTMTGGTAIKGGNIYAFDRNPCADADQDSVADKNQICMPM